MGFHRSNQGILVELRRGYESVFHWARPPSRVLVRATISGVD